MCENDKNNTIASISPISWSNSMGEFTLLNGVVGDTAIKAVFNQSGEITLFDLGKLDAMTYGELLTVHQAFISHAHFDHIIGFDVLLRATFPLNRPMVFAGPTGITRILAHRMKGYTWNLATPGQVDHTVREIHRDGSVKSWHLSNNDFEPTPAENELESADMLNPPAFDAPAAFVGRIKGGVRIYALCLDHAGIDSIAYAAVTDAKLKLRTDRLPELGLRPGPWVGAFQKDYLAGELQKSITVGEQTQTVGQLAETLLEIKPGERFCYLTDFGATDANLERVRPFIAGATHLGIETNFRIGQEDQAQANGHLTTAQAANLIAESGAKTWQTFHYSNAFQDCADEVTDETRSCLKKI
ncbi:MAG: hypothetical protein Q4D38_13150 [Planctomycetia bacterium]|nr:hypothetical protein [Planctomycetia bacterium]